MMKKTVIIKSILLGIVFLFAYSITFIHKEFNSLNNTKSYKNVKKNYPLIVKKANKETKELVSEMRAVGLVEYANKLDQINISKSKEIKAYKKQKNKIASELSFLGYESKRIFLYDFGKSILVLVPSLLLLLIVLNPSIIKELRKFLIIGVLGLLYVSFFWIFHNLFALTDFGIGYYRFSYAIGAVISTLLIYILFKFFSKVERNRYKKRKDLEEFLTSGNELVNMLKSNS